MTVNSVTLGTMAPGHEGWIRGGALDFQQAIASAGTHLVENTRGAVRVRRNSDGSYDYKAWLMAPWTSLQVID